MELVGSGVALVGLATATAAVLLLLPLLLPLLLLTTAAIHDDRQ
jgi:hypothetical protein